MLFTVRIEPLLYVAVYVELRPQPDLSDHKENPANAGLLFGGSRPTLPSTGEQRTAVAIRLMPLRLEVHHHTVGAVGGTTSFANLVGVADSAATADSVCVATVIFRGRDQVAIPADINNR